MKYAVLIGDGMADSLPDEPGALTSLKGAHIPNMDKLARRGIIGKVRTVPPGFKPGSDVANLSILGYNPAEFHTGRAPLEAPALGVKLKTGDVAYRCNLVTLNFSGDKIYMLDNSAGQISTPESRELVTHLNRQLKTPKINFYPGVSYRHLMVWSGGPELHCTFPHEILEKEIKDYLPAGEGSRVLRDLIKKSWPILASHPVNLARKARGEPPANSIWFWGAGKRPLLPLFKEKYGLSGGVISGVDLPKGIGCYAGLEIIEVPGATGWMDTNYSGKVKAALSALEKLDFIYLHINAPDEAAHLGRIEVKIKTIEDFDRLVVGEMMIGLVSKFPEFKVLFLPDHVTDIKSRTHSGEPVPFAIYTHRIKKPENPELNFDESISQREDILVFAEGYKLMDYFLSE